MEGMWFGNLPKNNQATTNSTPFRQLPDKTFHCNSEGVNVENLNSIFDISASLSNLKISNRKPKKMNNNDKQFNEECKNLRKKLRNLSNQNHRDPENLSLRLHYGESLKQYRNTLQKIRNSMSEIQVYALFGKQEHTKQTTRGIYPKWRCVDKPLLQPFRLFNKGQTAKTFTCSNKNLRISY